jgi:hypothetical protein
MPGVVSSVASAVGWILTAEGTLAAIARFAAGLLLSVVASKLFGPKLPKGTGLSGIQVTTRSTTEFRKVVYGQALVSGPVVYNNTSFPNNQDLWFVIPMCQGLSEDLIELRLDGDVIPKADIDWTAGSGASDGTGTGEVSTAKFLGSDSPASTGMLAYYYLGDDAQPVNGDLDTTFTDITTAFRLRGVTHVIFRLRYNDATAEVWKEGIPRNLKAVIKGRLVYDSRLDSTNGGSGAHRFATPSTWEWSENPALAVADYLMTYMGVDPALSINWPATATAADACDVLVEIPPVASPANTEKRFTCNGALSLGSTHKDNLDALLSSMDGRLSYVSGQWTVRASVWEASSESLVEDDLAGNASIQGSAPRTSRFNTVRGFYIDPAEDYQPVEFPLISKAAYVTRDNGGVLEFELSLPFTNSNFMAQRIAFRLLEQGNNQEEAQLPLKALAADIAVGDVIDLTLSDLGWSAKTFRVLNWARESSTIFNLSMREDIAASYDDPLVAEYTILVGNTLTKPADIVPPPSGLAAVGVDFGIKLTWVNPAATLFDTIEVYESDSNAWAGATKVAEIFSDTITLPYTTAVAKWFWIRARRLEVQSLRNPNNDVSSITATPTILVDGEQGPQGDPGATGQRARVVNIYKLNDSTITDDTQGTFADPLDGMEAGWGFNVPSLVSDNDQVFGSVRTFTDDAAAPQDASWSTPTIYAQRTDGTDGATGDPGTDAQDTRFPSIFRLNSSAINSTSGTFADPLAGNAAWSFNVPALVSDGDQVFITTRILTSDAAAPQEANWSTPAIYSQRTDGTDGAQGGQGDPGDDGAAGADGADGPASHGVLLNGGFETGDESFWTLSQPGIVIDDATARTGTYYLRIASGAGGPNQISDRYSAPAEGREVRVSCFARRDESDQPSLNASLGVRWYDSADAAVGGRITVQTGDRLVAGWQSLTGVAIVPATAVSFALDLGEAAGTGAWEFDDCSAIVEGVGGNFTDTKFRRDAAAPATPTGDNPSGWFDDIPAGGDTLWQINGTKNQFDELQGVWSTPSQVQGLVYRGTYSSGTAYILNDMVTFQERTYICTTATTGNDPTGTNGSNTWWDLLAGKGDPGDPPTPFVETIVIGNSTGPVDLRALANAHSPAYDGIADATITYTIASGIVVVGGAGGAHGIVTGSWPSGPTIDLTVENEGTVRGGGGSGGKGGNRGNQNGSPGLPGGDAFDCSFDLTIDNVGGLIQASGGGAGGGGGLTKNGGEPLNHGGGGGGGGFPNGGGGAGGVGDQGSNGAAGSPGTTGGGGAGGGGANTAGDGGNGGNVNVNGGNGTAATGGIGNGSGGSGAARGFAVRKNGNTVTVTGGTVTGQQG